MTSVDQTQLLTATTASADAPAPWKSWRLVGGVLLTAACVYITRDPWAKMFAISLGDEESSHVMLAPIAMLWLILSRRHRLPQGAPTGTWIGPVIVAVGWCSLLYGYDIHDNEFWFLGAILMATGCVLSFAGLRVLVRFWPAFAALLFLIPVPGLLRIWISMPLQTAMAHVTQHASDLLGFMIDRTGNALIINGKAIEVAEACNGMRMVFALLLVGYTVAFATPLRWFARLLVLVAAPAFALGCNLLRMLPTVWLYGHASHRVADSFHAIAGWAMVFLGYFLLLGMLELLDWAGVPVMQAARPGRRST